MNFFCRKLAESNFIFEVSQERSHGLSVLEATALLKVCESQKPSKHRGCSGTKIDTKKRAASSKAALRSWKKDQNFTLKIRHSNQILRMKSRANLLKKINK